MTVFETAVIFLLVHLVYDGLKSRSGYMAVASVEV